MASRSRAADKANQKLHAWVAIPAGPPNDDTGYLLGHLNGIFDKVTTARYHISKGDICAPPEDADVIVALRSIQSHELIDRLGEYARRLGIAMTSPAAALSRCIDKRRLADFVPDLAPPTRIVDSMDGVRAAFEEFGRRIVVKGPISHHGDQVERVLEATALDRAERMFEMSLTGDIIVQPYFGGLAAGDTRVMITRGPGEQTLILGALRRIPAPGDWKANISRGATAELCELDADDRALASRVFEASGLDYAGLDLACHDGRRWIIEVNTGAAAIIDYDLASGGSAIKDVGAMVLRRARGRTSVLTDRVAPGKDDAGAHRERSV